MKYSWVFAPMLVTALIISGCGTAATPTAAPVDVEGTVAAAALTVIAETQAAVPTATPPPPTATATNTPPPTDTPLPLPSLQVSPPAPIGNTGGEDPCIYEVMPAPLQGETIRMRIHNSTRVMVSVTVYLNQAEPGSQCGYRSYSLAPQEVAVINDLVEACYTIWAWNPDQDAYFIVTNGTSCLDGSNRWVFDISTSSIKLGT